MPKIFQKTIQRINILIQDKSGKFLLTKPIPYGGAQFPNQGLLRYLKQKDIKIQQKYKLLRYHHKVSKQEKSLEMLATFWVQTERDHKEISKILEQDQNKDGKDLIKEYKDLIDRKVFAGSEVFVWEGDELVDVPQ